MRRLAPIALPASLTLALVACSANPPPPRDSIRFSHGPHLAKSIPCTRCHARASMTEEEASAAARAAAADAGAARPDGGAPAAARVTGPSLGASNAPLLPSEAECRSCHTEGRQQECRFCHTRPQAAAGYPRPPTDIWFDHTSHLERTRGNCVRCHGRGVTDAVARGFQPRAPDMAACTSSGCHADDMRALRCSECHRDLHTYELEDLRSFRHPPGWARRHGRSARAETDLCGQCHEPTFCSRCHTSSPGMPLELVEPMGVDRDFVHRGDFVARHSTEARLERGTCARCHGVPFCDECHRTSGIGGGVAPSSAHPPGWVDPLSPNNHARAAQRDLMSCAACHESDAR
ncbi:MAG: hypothetical protein IT379_28935, partial [Deltaproteobacteria bacterium]|nr:hypothetical protein [Deltaproteobacteria bacterium]